MLDNNAYGPNGSHHIKAFGFQITPLRDIVRYLASVDLVYYKKGKKFSGKPSATRVFPAAELAEQLWMYFLDIEQDIKPPYVTIKDSSDGWGRLVDRSVKIIQTSTV
jgi:seryl-tRNA synthetase